MKSKAARPCVPNDAYTRCPSVTGVADGQRIRISARGHAGDDRKARNIACNYRTGADQRAFANRYTGEDRRIAADRRAPLDPRRHHLPVGFGLQAAVFVDRRRVQIVGEHHA